MFKFILGFVVLAIGWLANSLGSTRLDQGLRFSGASPIFVGFGSIAGGLYTVVAIGLT
jgi:hypothetical protein